MEKDLQRDDESKQAGIWGKDFQRSILRLMMQDSNFAKKSIRLFNGDKSFFMTNLQFIFTQFRNAVEVDKREPTYTDITIAAESLMRQDKKFFELQKEANFLLNMPALDPSNAAAVISQLTSYLRANIFYKKQKELLDLFNSRKYDETYRKLNILMTDIKNAVLEEGNVITIDNLDNIIERSKKQYANACKTGIIPIDKEIGGLLPQTFTTFIGASNSGKSMLSPTIAKVNALIGKKVVVSIHEDEEIPTKMRFIACFSDIPVNKLRAGVNELTQEELERYVDAEDLLRSHVRLMFLYGKNCTLEVLESELSDLKKEWDFDLFICDYGQCLQISDPSASRTFKGDYDKMGYIYAQLKQICLNLNVAGCGGAQGTRESNKTNKKGSDFIRTTDVGDCFTIIKKSSNVITINRSDELAKIGRIVFLLDKAREGKAPVAVQCHSDYSRSIAFYHAGEQTIVNDLSIRLRENDENEETKKNRAILHEE